MRTALAALALVAAACGASAGVALDREGETRRSAAPRSAVQAGPFPLVTLPSLGTVSWRCGARDGVYSLAFRVGRRESTTTVSLFLDGRRVSGRVLQPGSAHRFRDAGRHQRLVLVQRTGAGTIRARVDATFLPPAERVASHCWPYSPPRLDVAVSARR